MIPSDVFCSRAFESLGWVLIVSVKLLTREGLTGSCFLCLWLCFNTFWLNFASEKATSNSHLG